MALLNVEKTIDLCAQQYQARFAIDRNTILLFLNIVQKMILEKDISAFLVWDDYIVIKRVFTFSSTGYTNAVLGDVGKTVIGTTSGATGTLDSYDNDTMAWLVTPVSGTFLETEDVTIDTGTGAGTLTSVVGYRGPYTANSDNKPIRKIFGVTSLRDDQLFGYVPPWAFSSLETQGFTDYGLFKTSYSSIMQKFTYISGRINNLDNTFKFVADPVLTEDYYRMVYYQDAPEIEDETDDEHYIIPDRFRYSVVGMIGILAENSLYGSQPATMNQLLKPYLDDIWKFLEIQNAESFGNNSDSIGFSDGMGLNPLGWWS